MLKNIFLPDSLGSYYIFSTYILAFNISKSRVIAVLTRATGYKRYIENILDYDLEKDYINSDLSYEDHISNAINYIISNVKRYNKIFVNISSYKVIFKDFDLPPLDRNKIYQILPFELENVIPFPLVSAEYDFIFTDKISKGSKILVSVVKNDIIFEYIDIFSSLNLSIDKFSSSIIDIYKFYRNVYKAKEGLNNIALISIGDIDSKVIILQGNDIKYIRVINKGIIDNTINEISSLDDLLKDISLTLDSYIDNNIQVLNKFDLVIFLGIVLDDPLFNIKVKDYISFDIDYLNLNNIFNKRYDKLHLIDIHGLVKNRFLDPVLLSLDISYDYNLYKGLADNINYTNTKSQFKFFISLLIILFSLIISFSFYNVLNIRSTYFKAYNETITYLKDNIKDLNFDNLDLERAIYLAKRYISKDSLYHNLINDRYFILKYLIELSKNIDMKNTELNLIKLEIRKDVIKLYGDVPNHDKLNKLQDNLRSSPLFKIPNRLQSYNFKTEPLIIELNKNN